MNFSRLVGVKLENFMSFKDADMRFGEDNIINIKGYNDSGKSSIIRAIEVCLMDRYRSKQASLIRDGEDFFRVICLFSDGVKVVRVKYKTGQSLYEMYDGADLLWTSKVNGTLTKIEGVPEKIAEYLGLCVTEKGVCLNSRKNTDPQLLVETSGSENYSFLNDALKIAEISRAVEMVNADRNEKNREVSSLEAELGVVRARLASKGADGVLEKLVMVRERESKEREKKVRLLRELLEGVGNLRGVAVPPAVAPVAGSRLSLLGGALAGACSLGAPVRPSVAPVSGSLCGGLGRLSGALGGLLVASRAVPCSVAPVAGSRLSLLGGALGGALSGLGALGGALSGLGALVEAEKGIGALEKRKAKGMAVLEREIEKLREEGLRAVVCEKCGSANLVGVDSVGDGSSESGDGSSGSGDGRHEH